MFNKKNLFRKSLETIGREREKEISLKDEGEGMELGDKACGHEV